MSTATVETLTAEVRVLMVGNRQVTLSVYRQLDSVALEDVDPFGRVNDGKDSGLWVVGRRRATGELVRSEYLPRHRIEPPWVLEEDLTEPLVICRRLMGRAIRNAYAQLRYRDTQIRVDKDALKGCGIDHESSGCEGWQVNGQQDALDEVLREHAADIKRHQAAAALPLIVLAGLR